MLSSVGCWPEGQATQLMPSGPFSFEAQRLQNVECSRNVQDSPNSQGFSSQRLTVAASPTKAPSGSSKLVFVMVMLRAAMDMSTLPCAAMLLRKIPWSMPSAPPPAVAMAPPCNILSGSTRVQMQYCLGWATTIKNALCETWGERSHLADSNAQCHIDPEGLSARRAVKFCCLTRPCWATCHSVAVYAEAAWVAQRRAIVVQPRVKWVEQAVHLYKTTSGP
jgi:hypothetical protein